jgi:hypothetical protein
VKKVQEVHERRSTRSRSSEKSEKGPRNGKGRIRCPAPRKDRKNKARVTPVEE